ncbi:MAG: glycosyltransferase [Gemmataceae bacterium]
MQDLALPFVMCFLASLALTPVVRGLANRLAPSHGRLPAVGGIVFLLATFIPLLVAYASTWGMGPTHRDRAVSLVVGCAILCVVGVYNDYRPLRGRQMLLGQLLAVVAVLWSDLTVPEFRFFQWTFQLGMFGKIVSGLVLLAAINAFRCLDEMDGLVTCLGIIVMSAIALMALSRGQPAAAATGAGAAGVLVGLLRYNFPPATVRLGTSGSMLTGLVIGMLAIAGAVKGPAAITLAAPTALLTIPLFDFVVGLIRRRLSGRGLYTKDQNHLYHCLQRRGLGQRWTIVVVGLLCLVTATGALAAEAFRNEVYAMLGALAVVAILIATRLFGRAEMTLLGQHLKATAYSFVPLTDRTSSPVGAVDWDRLWQELVTECAGPLALKEMGLCIAGDATTSQPFEVRWHIEGRFNAAAKKWRAEIPLEVGDRPAGRLDVVGFEDDQPHDTKLAELARRVQNLGTSTATPAEREGVHVVETTRLMRSVPMFAVNIARLRVCHLGKFYPPAPGGIETHVQTLARAQAALEMDVRVLCTNHANTDGHDITNRRFARTRTTDESDGSVRVSRVGRFASMAKLDVCPRLAIELQRLMLDPPHILHLHTPNPTMLLAVACFCPALPLVVTHHSDVVKQRFLHYPYSVFERLVYGRATRILTTSPKYAAGSTTLRGFLDRVEDLPLGLDLTPFLKPSDAAIDYARQLRGRLGGPIWLCVGRLTYYKAFHLALEALVDTPGRLVVIGTGPLDGELRQRANDLGISDRVLWLGHATQDELVGAYLAATALWFPSNARSEGFGLVQVEAMAAGCPVINTAVPDSGVTWVAQDGVTGLTVPTNDSKALSVAARQLLDDRSLRQRLVAAGRQRAIEEFDHEVMARRSLEIYRRVLEREQSNGRPGMNPAVPQEMVAARVG